MIRKPMHAGTWYPVTKNEIEKYFTKNSIRVDSKAIICPHAGWIYSGKVAGSVYSKINPADTYIIISPNHTGMGTSASIFSDGIWDMPLGKIDVDSEIAGEILSSSKYLVSDTSAHIKEHSIEVQIPFIQFTNPDAKIVPITLMTQSNEEVKDIAFAISKTIKKVKNKKIIIVASTDLTHYEPHRIASEKDSLVINAITKLDEKKMLSVVEKNEISMCGVYPTAVVIIAAKDIGANKAELVLYQTSGDITGDKSSVVGYAGIIIR